LELIPCQIILRYRRDPGHDATVGYPDLRNAVWGAKRAAGIFQFGFKQRCIFLKPVKIIASIGRA
jgi:hypothetical protein